MSRTWHDLTPEQATEVFVQLATQDGHVKPEQLDRDAIREHFAEIFSR